MNPLLAVAERFPIRRNKEQKTAFLTWAAEEISGMGYDVHVERNSKHQNLVVGDPERARVVFTAHYDTPSASPFPNIMMPRNVPLFYAYQFAIVGVLLAVSVVAGRLAAELFHSRQSGMLAMQVVYWLFLLFMIAGPANKHNMNDNTSGTATVLAVLEALPPELRTQTAFILFDNEEKGKLGSKAYAKEHPAVKENTLIVNMDCCGLGDHVLLIGKERACAKASYALLEHSFLPNAEIEMHSFSMKGSTCNSDQLSFDCGAVICACRKMPVVGFYTPYIHTSRDTAADAKNIDYIVRSLVNFVKAQAEN